MEYPWVRLRRVARSPALRRLVRSVRPVLDNVLLTYQVNAQDKPGKLEELLEQVSEAALPGLYLVPVVRRRDNEGSEIWKTDSPMAQSLQSIRKHSTELAIFAELDLALHTCSGRPGPITEGMIDAEMTHEALAKAAVCLGESGADIVAIRGHVDNAVSVVREALDESGLEKVGILSFSADFHSVLADLRPLSADKAADLMDVENPEMVYRSMDLDQSEGADYIGVQPASLSLDIIRDLSEETDLPILARITEKEAKMWSSAVSSSSEVVESVALELHSTLFRAGARMIASPWALQLATGVSSSQ